MNPNLIESICKDQPCHGSGYCLFKEIVGHKVDSRLLMQIDCVNRFKYDEGLRTKQDPGWREAWRLWAERGYAAKFAELYDENISPLKLYQMIVGG